MTDLEVSPGTMWNPKRLPHVIDFWSTASMSYGALRLSASEVLLQHPLLSHIDVSPRVCYNTLELHKQLTDVETPTPGSLSDGRSLSPTSSLPDWCKSWTT